MQTISSKRTSTAAGALPPRRRYGIALVLLGALAAPVHGAGFTLVTPAEHAEAMSAPDDAIELVPKAVPGGPSIDVVSPLVGGDEIASPVDIEVRFAPAGDATIDMSTLRIYYVMLIRKDVTDRILEHAEVGADSIRALGADLPSGKHRFVVEIADSEQRVASRKFTVRVDG